jgi:hypothetical protein
VGVGVRTRRKAVTTRTEGATVEASECSAWSGMKDEWMKLSVGHGRLP